MARNPRLTLSGPAGSEQDNDGWTPSDEELGVGEETEAERKAEEAARITAAMADPVIATAIDQLVQQRVTELAASPQTAPTGVDFIAAIRVLAQEMATAINRSTAATVEQIPGHVKPIPAEEVEKRAAAWVELQSQLIEVSRRYAAAIERKNQYEAERETPIYWLGEDFYGPGEVGNEVYVRGETIRWFGVPGIYMEPRNDIANRLCELAWTYLGNEGAPTPEQLADKAQQMMKPSAPGSPLPELASLLSARGQRRPMASRVSEMGIAERQPDGIVGTVVKVTRGGFGHGIVTDGPGLAQHSIGPRTGPHPVRGAALADAGAAL
jgi:hypothetical protein